MGTLAQELDRLYRRQNFGIKLGLDVVSDLAAEMGNPHEKYACVHVAGTNGKGSVCAMAASIFRAAGFRSGLYTSPHLVRFNERITVDGRQIEDEDILVLMKAMDPVVAKVEARHGREVTFFEYTTVMAMEYFRRAGVRVAVLETGMGGRLDATNIVVPVVSAVTAVGLEHTKYLGPDIESIAREKGGIIKQGRPVVCGGLPSAAMDVIGRIAKEKGAPLIDASSEVSIRVLSADLSGYKVSIETGSATYPAVRVPLAGRYQLENLAVVVALVESFGREAGIDVAGKGLADGLSSVRWPGRFQVVSASPLVIVDGAHNPDGAKALADTLKRFLKGRPVAMVLGMCDDKDARSFVQAFGGMVQKCWAVRIRSERSLAAKDVAGICRLMKWDTVEATVPEAVADGREWAKKTGGALVVTGSLFLAGEVLEAGTD